MHMVCTLVIVCWVWKPFLGSFLWLPFTYFYLWIGLGGSFSKFIFILNGPEDSFFCGFGVLSDFSFGRVIVIDATSFFCVALVFGID